RRYFFQGQGGDVLNTPQGISIWQLARYLGQGTALSKQLYGELWLSGNTWRDVHREKEWHLLQRSLKWLSEVRVRVHVANTEWIGPGVICTIRRFFSLQNNNVTKPQPGFIRICNFEGCAAHTGTTAGCVIRYRIQCVAVRWKIGFTVKENSLFLCIFSFIEWTVQSILIAQLRDYFSRLILDQRDDRKVSVV